MSSTSKLSTLAPPTLSPDFQADVQAVQTLLHESVGNLPAPLDRLALAEVRKDTPYIYALAVLATCAGDGTGIGPSTAGDKSEEPKHISLAAALQMLSVALNVHMLLLDEASETEKDRTLVGGIILAGDYCFSQAALLAAKTDSPSIVQIFSQALRNVSENKVATLHSSSATQERGEQPDQSHDTMQILLQAGTTAATELVCLSAEELKIATKYCQLFYQNLSLPSSATADTPSTTLPRWSELIRWTARTASNDIPI